MKRIFLKDFILKVFILNQLCTIIDMKLSLYKEIIFFEGNVFSLREKTKGEGETPFQDNFQCGPFVRVIIW